MSTKTETPSTIAKMLVTALLSVMLLMINRIPTSMIGYLRVLIPQGISPERPISYRVDILFWGSVIICLNYMKPYYDKLIKLFESVGASFAAWEFTYELLALSEQEMSKLGGLPGIFTFTGLDSGTPSISPRDIDSSSLAETRAASITVPIESYTPGFTMKEALTPARGHSPSSPSASEEQTATKCGSPKPREKLPREKSPLDKKTADIGPSYAGAPPTLPPTLLRSLRWHSQGKYLDGTRIPPRRKQNTYTAESPSTPKKAATPSQGGVKTATSKKNKQRVEREEPDISDLLSPESRSPLTSALPQNTPSRQATLPTNDPLTRAESLTPPPSSPRPPARRRPLHKRLEQLISSHNRKSLSSRDPNPSASNGRLPEDEDTIMQEVSLLDSRYISNAMGSWGTTREPVSKEEMVVAVSTSWSKDQKTSLNNRDYLDGVSEEDVLRITNLWAAGLLEVCERKLGEVIL